jgi:hypothetical protein
LQSYDTRHAICFLFVPIIPLGKRRINSHCKRCDRFYQIPWKEWFDSTEEYGSLLSSELAGGAPDRDKVLASIVGIAQMQSIKLIHENLDSIDRVFRDDEEVQATLAGVLLSLGDFSGAYPYSVRAFELNHSDENRELLGIIALNTGKLEEARAAFQFIMNGALQEKYNVLEALVECYQEQGRHDEALDLLEAMEKAFPNEATQKETKRLRKISNKHAGTDKSVVPKSAPKKGSTKLSRGLQVAVLLLVILGFVGASIYQGSTHDVYFLNGLPSPYTVEIDGSPYTLSAARVIPIPIGDGDFTVHVVEENLGLNDVEISVRTNFFTRLFISDIFVVNPDASGFIGWEDIPYSESNSQEVDDRYQNKVHFGSTTYEFADIDFIFEESPDEISTESSGIIMRKALSNYTNLDYTDSVDYIAGNHGESALFNFLRLVIASNPMDSNIHAYASQYLSPENAVKVLEPYLEQRMDDLHYHRYYQEAAQFVYSSEEIHQRYQGYLDQSPENPDLLYLLGRNTIDPAKANEFYKRAYSAPEPSVWAAWAYTYNLLANAKFEEALEFSSVWTERFPENEPLAGVAMTVAMATGDYDSITAKFESDLKEHGQDINFVAKGHFNVMLAYCVSGNSSGADQLLKWLSVSPDPDYSDYVQSTHDNLSLFREYITGQGSNLATLDEVGGTIHYGEEKELLDGNYKKIESDPANIQENQLWENVILYGISAMLNGDESEGLAYFTKVAVMLSESSNNLAMYASALRGNEVDHARFRAYPIPESSKILLLIAMGYMNPAEKTADAEFASALNYSFQYPQYLIRSALSDLKAN